MKNNYQIMVSAFVDGDRIIETAPTDYLSWGVGAIGNPHSSMLKSYTHTTMLHLHVQ